MLFLRLCVVCKIDVKSFTRFYTCHASRVLLAQRWQLFKGKFLKFWPSLGMWGSTNVFGWTGLAVLTFIEHKQTDKQSMYTHIAWTYEIKLCHVRYGLKVHILFSMIMKLVLLFSNFPIFTFRSIVNTKKFEKHFP